jgi:tetratricopeptide (TPR) repeat protein
MIRTRFVPALLALALLPASAPAAGPLDAPRAALQTGVDRGDLRAILAARSSFAALAAADARAAAPRYWVALSDWRALPLLMGTDREQARRLVQDGMQHAGEALALDPSSGAASALEAGLEGLAIGLDPGSMMTLGPAAETHLANARRLSPSDPRVWLFDGIQALNKPAAFGGGVEPALERLTKATTLFASLAPDSDAYGWGRDDVHLWAGRAEMARHAYAAAIACFRRALAANPANGWVARSLLPEAEKALAATEAR